LLLPKDWRESLALAKDCRGSLVLAKDSRGSEEEWRGDGEGDEREMERWEAVSASLSGASRTTKLREESVGDGGGRSDEWGMVTPRLEGRDLDGGRYMSVII
jgi:hypothetical protein